MANPIHDGEYFVKVRSLLFQLIKKAQIILHLKAKYNLSY